MSDKTNIQWTDATWNIGVGCTKVDEDCKFCYMYRDSMNGTRYDPKVVRKTKTVFNFPLKYKETNSAVWGGNPLIFTSSLTDFFHPALDEARREAWDIIRRCPHLTFQILTKRPERILDCLKLARDQAAELSSNNSRMLNLTVWLDEWINGNAPENVWLGTSVGSNAGMGRVNTMLNLTTKKWRCKFFLSMEPLYERPTILLTESIKYFDWVIVGGESGNENGKYRYRPCEFEWIESITEACEEFGVPVFVKQLGTYLAKRHGLGDRHGAKMENWPMGMQVREFPGEVRSVKAEVRKEESDA